MSQYTVSSHSIVADHAEPVSYLSDDIEAVLAEFAAMRERRFQARRRQSSRYLSSAAPPRAIHQMDLTFVDPQYVERHIEMVKPRPSSTVMNTVLHPRRSHIVCDYLTGPMQAGHAYLSRLARAPSGYLWTWREAAKPSSFHQN